VLAIAPSYRRLSPRILIADLLAGRESKIHFDIVCWVATRLGPTIVSRLPLPFEEANKAAERRLTVMW